MLLSPAPSHKTASLSLLPGLRRQLAKYNLLKSRGLVLEPDPERRECQLHVSCTALPLCSLLVYVCTKYGCCVGDDTHRIAPDLSEGDDRLSTARHRCLSYVPPAAEMIYIWRAER